MPLADATTRRIHLLSALVVLSAFVAGAAAGVGFYRWAAPDRGPPPRPGPGLPPHLATLGLSPEQERKASEIFDRHRPELESILRESYPRMRAVLDETHREVRALLTPEQQKRFDEMDGRAPPFGMPGGPGMGHLPRPPPGMGGPPPPGLPPPPR